MDPILMAFIINLASSVTWDGIKKTFSKVPANNPERQAMLAVVATMENFYQYMGFEYDEDIVMDSFLEAVRQYQDMIWHLRNVIEYTINQDITDEQFEYWVDVYKKKSLSNEKPFVERDQTIARIKYKLHPDDICSYGNLDTVIDWINNAFNSSWKQDVIDLLEPLNLDLSFARKPEKYDVILSFFRELTIDLDQLEDEKALYRYLDHPHFNKVQLVCGTSGSGKTHFVEEYTRIALRQFGKVPIPCKVHSVSLHTLQFDIIESLHQFLEVECNSLENYNLLLDALSIQIVFVIENINELLNDDWEKVVNIIKDYTRFETFKFIITINEYEYYQVEEDNVFLERYCIENDQSRIFNNCLSINEFNLCQDVVGKILLSEYKTESECSSGLTTPQEAIYYGECVRDEKDVSPPSSYYEYIVKITQWKEKQVRSAPLNQILRDVLEQKSSIVRTGQDVTLFRHAQLITPEKQSIFDTVPTYHLRVYPYWAAKIVGSNEEDLLDYSDDLKEWLIACYIFYRYQGIGIAIGNLQSFFNHLHSKGFLVNAIFCAYKADIGYIRGLYHYLFSIEIDSPQLCYAVLRFVGQTSLKIAEKFRLCTHMAKELDKYGLLDFYSRTLGYILETAVKANSLRKNMLALVSCTVEDINHINGYNIGERYMELIEDGNVRELTWVIVQYIIQNNLEVLIAKGGNKSFLDYFLRKCFEYYIGHHTERLGEIYNDLQSIINLKSPIGPFVKRNLTCAAGNLFENRPDKAYKEEYIRVAQQFAETDELYDRLTAWFLISNSVTEPNDELDEELLDIMKGLMLDPEIMSKVGMEIEEYAKNNNIET